LLSPKTDYTIKYKNTRNAYVIKDAADLTGQDKKKAPQIMLSMKGNYKGKQSCYFSIEPLSISDDGQFYAYIKDNGKTKKPVLMWNGNVLKEKKDYIVSTTDDSVILTGIKNFTDTRTISLTDNTVNPNMVSMKDVSAVSIPAQVYTGSAYTVEDLKKSDGISALDFALTYENVPLVPGADYEIVKIQNARNTGNAMIVIRGLGPNGKDVKTEKWFVGEKRVSFTIQGYPLDGDNIRITGTDGNDKLTAEYAKTGSRPDIRVLFGDVVLKEKRDYTIKLSNNAKYPADNATITITGKGNFSGAVNRSFTVTQRIFSEYNGVEVIATDKACPKKAGQYATAVKVLDNGKLLKAGTDYASAIVYLINGVELDKNYLAKEGDVITVRIKGQGAYTGDTIETTYKILPSAQNNDIGKAKIKIKDQVYDKGNTISIRSQDQFSQAVIGKNKTELILSTDGGVTGDFMIVPGSYFKNDNKGIAQVTVKGINKYSGVKTIKFRIVPFSVK
ncbi:MAG: hypothetical protein IKO11_04865, partial [Lachnospiraceae bacterium]|nr:hypothetical protein [Lachnospiraceae bacterium]